METLWLRRVVRGSLPAGITFEGRARKGSRGRTLEQSVSGGGAHAPRPCCGDSAHDCVHPSSVCGDPVEAETLCEVLPSFCI